MLSPENIFISRYEYEKNIDERIKDESTLDYGQVYSLMFSLKPDQSNREAATLAAKIHSSTVAANGLYLVKMALVDEDLEPYAGVKGHFENGFWVDIRQKGFRILSDDNTHRPDEAYIKSYAAWDEFDGLRQAWEIEKEVLDSHQRVAEMAGIN